MVDHTFLTGIQARAADISKPAYDPLIQRGHSRTGELDDRSRQW
jgi:hypothetical protein